MLKACCFPDAYWPLKCMVMVCFGSKRVRDYDSCLTLQLYATVRYTLSPPKAYAGGAVDVCQGDESPFSPVSRPSSLRTSW